MIRLHDPAGEFRAAIYETLRYTPNVIEPGRQLRFSTNGKRGDTSGYCKLFDDLRAGIYGDWRSGLQSTWCARGAEPLTLGEQAALQRHLRAAQREREAVQRIAWASNAERSATLWAEGKPVTEGDSVSRYLAGRGLSGWPIPPYLRCHPALPYWHTGDDGELHMMGTFAAMLAPIMRGGQLLAVHRTYLDGGRKARLPTPKKLTSASGPLAGACVPLAAPRDGVLGIAEGIETAAAASLGSGLPVVAAYCAGALAGYQWPAGLSRLVIFGDADDAGRIVADKLRSRALAARLQCEVVLPSDEGADWCDVWAAREGATT